MENEPTGIVAIEELIGLLEPLKENIFNGRFIGFKRELKSIRKNQRFVDEDMNRLWVTSYFR